MSRVVTQSRAYDAVFDSTFTTPYTNVQADARVRASISKPSAVGGHERYKYSRRPIMPRLNAVPPQILLAPTVAQNPMVAIEEVPEPDIKEMGIQTVFRESEAQTVPYAPDYVVPEGTEPEVLLLKGLTHDRGLPVGQKEINMIENARRKQELEGNLPPFTDEASLMYRKRLMEFQELREFKLREQEMDSNREERLETLQTHLVERDEANEFLMSQRLESTRQSKMAEKERAVQKLRSKRIKILRRLAARRNKVDVLGNTKDIINAYFDKTSAVYAPTKRDGSDLPCDLKKFDIQARTAPLNNMNNIVNLEASISIPLLTGSSNITAHSATTGGIAKAKGTRGGGKAAEERLTSAAVRHIRNTKRDVEEMHSILLKKKLAKRVLTRKDTQRNFTGNQTADKSKEDGAKTAGSSLLSKKPKGRPTTPDLVNDANGEAREDRIPITAACMLLQRLLRGRAIQNTMHEGRIRRRELIAELREVDVLHDTKTPQTIENAEAERQQARAAKIRQTTIDAIAGSSTSNILAVLSQEHDRREYIQGLTARAQQATEERLKLEAAEAGRRQREGLKIMSVASKRAENTVEKSETSPPADAIPVSTTEASA